MLKKERRHRRKKFVHQELAMFNTVLHGDCLELMKDIPDKSIDMILCDLPYGTTSCSWDRIIPFELLWEQYERIIKDYRAIVLFGSEPFSSYLRVSNITWFKYDWIWKKSRPGGFTNAKFKPLNDHEIISVFSNGTTANCSKKLMYYTPLGIVKNIDKSRKNSNPDKTKNNNSFKRPSHQENFKLEYTNYPRKIIEFGSAHMPVHPTQKPVELLEYLIRTYTLEGDVVLDNCAGSGSTGIACINTNRNYILMEKEKEYFDIINNRINESKNNLEKFFCLKNF